MSPRSSRLLAAALLSLVLGVLAIPGGSGAASPPVSVFPTPGSRVVSPQAQIAFRGIPAGQLGTIIVTGSRSGLHTGTVRGDSDGRGASWLPTKPFIPGESVQVRSGLNVVGGRGGSFSFMVAYPAGEPPAFHWPTAPRARYDVWTFHSRPDLTPAAVRITTHGRTAPGDLFLASQYGPVQDGPEIVDSQGNLVWFKRMTGDFSSSDVRVQSYRGKPVLTWWQGYVGAGVGVGEDVINNTAYQVTGYVRAANGLFSDLHEFEITPQNTALITSYFPVYWDASSVHGSRQEIVLDSVVQEIDIPTGLLLFQWDSLDHVPLSDTYVALPKAGTRNPFDYFHVNSVEPDRDGTLIVSARDTSAIYKVDHSSGHIIWTLGGRHSSFRMGRGSWFAFQHDARIRSNHDWYITLFDDGGGPPRVHHSRGLKLYLDTHHMTATVAGQLAHAPALDANYEGNYQQLVGGDNVIGWGQQPYFTEIDSQGRSVLDGHFVAMTANYRAYRFTWSGAPRTVPSVAVSRHGGRDTVYVSWNGATAVSAWRVQGGSSVGTLRTLTEGAKRGFETSFTVSSQKYIVVQALGSRGRTLARSGAVSG